VTSPVSAVSRVPALLVTGAPGAGKSALVKELSEQLWRAQSFHAVVDLDELCRGVLPDATTDFGLDLAAANLAPVWANFRERGAQRLLLARIVQSPDDVRRIQTALPDCELTVCRIRVDHTTLLERIDHREPGTSREFLRSVALDLADTIDALDLPGFTVDNDKGQRISDLAANVLERLGWP